jgi:hypothetical protein
MDQDVKDYFFSLRPIELTEILDEYQSRHGRQAREYAAATIQKWRTNRVTMSGMVAERLFNLLPPRMPLSIKYKLVEGLWYHVGPSSKHRIRINADADDAAVLELAQSEISKFVVNYKIPDSLEQRFDWLAAGDVATKQMLLGHIQEMEKSVVIEAVRVQVPVMLEHMRSAGSHTTRLAQIVHVGKHELELLMDKKATGVQAEDPTRLMSSTSPSSRTFSVGTVLLILIVIFTIFLMFAQSYR